MLKGILAETKYVPVRPCLAICFSIILPYFRQREVILSHDRKTNHKKHTQTRVEFIENVPSIFLNIVPKSLLCGIRSFTILYNKRYIHAGD